MSTEPSVTSLSLSPDGSTLLWLSADGTLRSWNEHNLRTTVPLPNARLLSAGNRIVALADSTSPSVRFLSIDTLNLLPFVANAPVDAGRVLALTPPNDDAARSIHGIYALGVGEGVLLRSYAGADVATFAMGSAPFCAAIDPEGKRFAAGDSKGRVTIWEVESNGRRRLIDHAHKSFVACVTFVDGGVLSGGWDGFARLWELGTSVKKKLEVRADKGKVLAVAGGDGFFATGGTEGVMRVWDVKGRRVAEHLAHGNSIYALTFGVDGRHVVSGGADGSVRLFGVPTKPVLVTSENNERVAAQVSMGVIIKGQRADRQLVFCPSAVIALACPICAESYDACGKKPIVSGACGHTFACTICNKRLWDADKTPKCPICRVSLLDIAPNYELLRLLTTTATSQSQSPPSAESETLNPDYIALTRLSWLEAPELAYLTRPSCTIYNGKLDGEVVAIRLPNPAHLPKPSATSPNFTETERHVRSLKNLRGPHIAQFYGLSRLPTPDNRLITVSEILRGGTLATNLSLLRSQHHHLPSQTILSLSLQLTRTLTSLHNSGVSAGYSLSPHTLALSSPLSTDITADKLVKIVELGGTISKDECGTDAPREFPADFVSYMAPELLDVDLEVGHDREEVFERFCKADLYALGVVIWEIATGRVAYAGLRVAEIVGAVVGRGERPGTLPMGEIGAVIQRVWSGRPADRGTATEACQMLELVPSAPPG